MSRLKLLHDFHPHIVAVDKGASIASEGKGNYMFVEGFVKDVQGKPIPNAIIDTWETDGHGQYDTQVSSTRSLSFQCSELSL